jgi:coenzyme PQQ precursor peptide PqqA
MQAWPSRLIQLTLQSKVATASTPLASQDEEHAMTWKTPKIVEVSLAMEINSYACAEIV